MAGTSWDKLGQMDAAFEIVAPAIRRVAQADGVPLREFFRDDPVWRLDYAKLAAGDAAVDVAWEEDRPEEYVVTALWWTGEEAAPRLERQEAGRFTRDRPLEELESLLRAAAAGLPRR